MSNSDPTHTESPDIIEEIIPGKNDDYTNRSINENDSDDNQPPIIENYNEKEAALAVIEDTEESTKSVERNMDKARNQVSRHNKAIINTQEQTVQSSREIAENYLEFQEQFINSFQSVFIPYFQNAQNQLWNNQDIFQSLSKMYYRWVNNYTENVVAFSKMWNDIVFTNTGFFNAEIKKANK
ncbi:MAG TPA: hypothetical protein VJP58_02660 [Candidatus Nitrosocosmicus sp.]|nr:hypothetical protein [Candidatus Nitrosocosmicus sp.]